MILLQKIAAPLVLLFALISPLAAQEENYFDVSANVVSLNYLSATAAKNKTTPPLEYVNSVLLRYTFSEISIRAMAGISDVVCNSQTRLSSFAIAPAYKNDSSRYTGYKLGLGLQYRNVVEKAQVYGVVDMGLNSGLSQGASYNSLFTHAEAYKTKYTAISSCFGAGVTIPIKNNFAAGAEFGRQIAYCFTQTSQTNIGVLGSGVSTQITSSNFISSIFTFKLMLTYFLLQ